jgi:membrane protease YdiL (CAAX protease family)
MLVSFALLGPSICAVWLPAIRVPSWKPVPPWVVLFAAAVIAGLATDVLRWPGAASLLVLAALAWTARTAGNRWLRLLALVGVIVLALALAVHAVPGFKNPVVIDGVRFSADSAPFTQYANFDKGAVGLLLLALLAPHVSGQADARKIAYPLLIATIATSTAVFATAVSLGYVRWDPKWPPETLTFFSINLLFTCVAEEAFFRGVIQEQLSRALEGSPRIAALPIVVSTLLFALAHWGGGLQLVLLAGIAGLGYSICYAVTRRVEAAILPHFAVNSLHFVFFSYPYVAR